MVLYVESANGGILSGSGIASSIPRGSAEQKQIWARSLFLAMWEKHDGMRGGRQGVLGGLSPPLAASTTLCCVDKATA